MFVHMMSFEKQSGNPLQEISIVYFPYSPFSCSQIHKLHHFDINWSHHFSFSAHSDSSQFYLHLFPSLRNVINSKNSNTNNFWLDWLCCLAGNSLMTPPVFNILISWVKVHIFWEGHKILQNLHSRFVLCSASQIYGAV